MAFISEKDRKYLSSLFDGMEGTARLIVFTEGPSRLVVPGEKPCQYCRQTVELMEELGSLSGKIAVEVLDRKIHLDRAQEMGIDKVPAVIVSDDAGTRKSVRYFGIPAGYEFSALVEDIVDSGNGRTRLSQSTKDALAAIDTPVHLKVFVTPTCPYCPKAVRLAHQFAMESSYVTADMIEATEFPELAEKYGVYGVPKTVINETGELEGAVPEAHFLREVLAAIGAKAPAEPGGESGRRLP
ncbi:thioredoxin family protein [Carboxydochorda subterranea]|uniref:Thioredoxin family protein n=1 Tax=Carboxydichorda subterranea TaxID=3109565 RepID=A0ABZ1BYA2_9FIRM|nr:thioredoxin family protein [Limnochorda sp. L945t]WRP17693.1 thioredoxin family protein [Limnochorda sp. L945t]